MDTVDGQNEFLLKCFDSGRHPAKPTIFSVKCNKIYLKPQLLALCLMVLNLLPPGKRTLWVEKRAYKKGRKSFCDVVTFGRISCSEKDG